MKNKTILAMSLVAVLSLGMSEISFARGGGMGGGLGGSRGAAGALGGSGFGSGGGFHSSGQVMNAPRGGYGEQNQIRNRESIRHRSGVPGDADGTSAGDQLGYNNRSQGDAYGNRYGQQNDLRNNQRGGFGATPATPADPGTPGEPATQATPAILPGK